MATPITPQRIKLPSQVQAAEDLLLWRNVPKSAGVLATATLLYFLLEWASIPLLVWLSNVGIVLVLGTALWAVAAKTLHMTGPADAMPSVLKQGIDEPTSRQLADKARVALNDGLALVSRVLSGHDLKLALGVTATLWVVGWIGRIITPAGLLYSAVLGAFSLPKLYEMRKDDVDKGVAVARSHVTTQYNNVSAQVNDAIARLTPRKAAAPAQPKDE